MSSVMSLQMSPSKSKASISGLDQHSLRTRASKGKSRSGCVTCKKRKVKCDEMQPICTNCSKRCHDCVYKINQGPKWRESVSTFVLPNKHVKNVLVVESEKEDARPENVYVLARSATTLSASTLSAVVVQGFGIEDLYLLKQFESVTSLDILGFYKIDIGDVIKLGFHNEFLLHSMLTLAARHSDLHHQQQSTTPNYDFKSLEQHHLHQTLSKFHPALSPHSHTNQHATLATSFLLSLYSCSIADFHPFDPIPVADTSFTYLNGTRIIMKQDRQRSRRGIWRSILTPPPWIYMFGTNIRPDTGPGAIFISLLSSLPVSSPHRVHENIYLERMDSLTIRLTSTDIPHPPDDIIETITLCFIAWQACCPTAFVDLIRQYDPIALVILAHYYAAAGYIHSQHSSTWWWWRDKPKYMVETIAEFLGREWEEWMRWPVEMIFRY